MRNVGSQLFLQDNWLEIFWNWWLLNGRNICPFRRIVQKAWYALNHRRKFYAKSYTTLKTMLRVLTEVFPKNKIVKIKESCSALLHQRFRQQHYCAICTFSCISWRSRPRQLDMHLYQGHYRWMSCYWILGRARSIETPLQDFSILVRMTPQKLSESNYNLGRGPSCSDLCCEFWFRSVGISSCPCLCQCVPAFSANCILVSRWLFFEFFLLNIFRS